MSEKSTVKPLCISIGPYGNTEEEQSKREDLEIIIRESLDQFEYIPFPDVSNIVMSDDLFRNIVNCDLVVADLRNLNPNVMYELGLRHAFNRPTLHLKDPNTELPWDIDKNFTITYPEHITVSKRKGLIEEISSRVDRIMKLRDKESSSFNTFISSYKSAATISGLKENGDIKGILGEMNTSIKSLNHRIQGIEYNQNESMATSSYLTRSRAFGPNSIFSKDSEEASLKSVKNRLSDLRSGPTTIHTS